MSSTTENNTLDWLPDDFGDDLFFDETPDESLEHAGDNAFAEEFFDFDGESVPESDWERASYVEEDYAEDDLPERYGPRARAVRKRFVAAGIVAVLLVAAAGVVVGSGLLEDFLTKTTPAAEIPLPPADERATLKANVVVASSKELSRGVHLIDVAPANELPGDMADEYYRATLDGKTIYVEKRWVRLASEEPPGQWVGNMVRAAEIYPNAALLGSPLGTLIRGQEVSVLDEFEGVCYVECADGTLGYVDAASVSESASSGAVVRPAPAASSDDDGDDWGDADDDDDRGDADDGGPEPGEEPDPGDGPEPGEEPQPQPGDAQPSNPEPSSEPAAESLTAALKALTTVPVAYAAQGEDGMVLSDQVSYLEAFLPSESDVFVKVDAAFEAALQEEAPAEDAEEEAEDDAWWESGLLINVEYENTLYALDAAVVSLKDESHQWPWQEAALPEDVLYYA